MITYNKECGCYFQATPDARHYHLMEMMEYKGKKTSDIIAIWDFDNNALVGYHYGANTISIDELDHYVSEYVSEYEAKRADQNRAPAPITYKFTKEGTKYFIEDVSNDIFSELDSNNANMGQLEFTITIGKRTISVPMSADSFDRFDIWLTEAEREWNE